MKNNRTLPYVVPVSPLSKKKKINWVTVFASVNFVVNLWLIWAILEVTNLCGDLGDAVVFMSKTVTDVFHLSTRIHL